MYCSSVIIKPIGLDCPRIENTMTEYLYLYSETQITQESLLFVYNVMYDSSFQFS